MHTSHSFFVHGSFVPLPISITSPPINVDSSTSNGFKLSSLTSMTSVILLIWHTWLSYVYTLRICSNMSLGTKCDLVSWKTDHRSGNYKIGITYLPKTFTIFGMLFSRCQWSLSLLPLFSAYCGATFIERSCHSCICIWHEKVRVRIY